LKLPPELRLLGVLPLGARLILFHPGGIKDTIGEVVDVNLDFVFSLGGFTLFGGFPLGFFWGGQPAKLCIAK